LRLCCLDTLTEHNLHVNNVVGQGYDGGRNMRGASKGVQARIKALNPTALFTHCFAVHNLNRALVNAACDTTVPDVRNFFGVVELVFTFVEVLLDTPTSWTHSDSSTQTLCRYI